jgi:hypothetical protein
MERRGQRARQRRDRKRKCVREGGWLREEVALVVKTAIEENGPFGTSIGSEQRIILIAAKKFNDRNILLDYKVFLETVGMTTNHRIFPTLIITIIQSPGK